MKLNNTVVTLALVGVLALAALAGGLLPAGNAIHAADPGFALVSDTGCAQDRCVEENTPPGVNIGDPISATDDDEDAKEFGNTLTYSLGSDDEVSFDIDPSTGQLFTKAPLDFESEGSYSVTVTVDDGESRQNPITQLVRIGVTDVDEPPAAPYTPTVVPGEDDSGTTDVDESTTTLKVIWHEPENTGPEITNYDVQYKKTTDSVFSDGPQNRPGKGRHYRRIWKLTLPTKCGCELRVGEAD